MKSAAGMPIPKGVVEAEYKRAGNGFEAVINFQRELQESWFGKQANFQFTKESKRWLYLDRTEPLRFLKGFAVS